LSAFWFRSFFRRTPSVYVGISSISCPQIGNAKALSPDAAKRCDPAEINSHSARWPGKRRQTECEVLRPAAEALVFTTMRIVGRRGIACLQRDPFELSA
jgi:hypothetical protein